MLSAGRRRGPRSPYAAAPGRPSRLAEMQRMPPRSGASVPLRRELVLRDDAATEAALGATPRTRVPVG